jgi:hypothetical protein
MANELSWRHDTSGVALYATIRNTSRQYYNTDTPAWESLTVANWGDYVVAFTETPADSYFYVGDMPSIDDGWYWIDLFEQADASPAIDDTIIATLIGYWNGTTFQPTDANVITIAEDAVEGDTDITLGKALEMLAAFISGKVSRSSDAGVTTLTYKKRDGTTTSFTCVANEDDGDRETTGDLS